MRALEGGDSQSQISGRRRPDRFRDNGADTPVLRGESFK